MCYCDIVIQLLFRKCSRARRQVLKLKKIFSPLNSVVNCLRSLIIGTVEAVMFFNVIKRPISNPVYYYCFVILQHIIRFYRSWYLLIEVL